MKSHQSGTQREAPGQHRDQPQDVPFLRLPIHMDVQPITSDRAPQHLDEIVESSLDIDIGRVFYFPVLIDFENLADVPAPPQFVCNQLGLNRPTAHGGRIITDLQNFLWTLDRTSSYPVISHLDFQIAGIPPQVSTANSAYNALYSDRECKRLHSEDICLRLHKPSLCEAGHWRHHHPSEPGARYNFPGFMVRYPERSARDRHESTALADTFRRRHRGDGTSR